MFFYVRTVFIQNNRSAFFFYESNGSTHIAFFVKQTVFILAWENISAEVNNSVNGLLMAFEHYAYLSGHDDT